MSIGCLLQDILLVLDACWLGHAGAAEEGQGGGAAQEAAWVAQVSAVTCSNSYTPRGSPPACRTGP
jgi:hypothetical protein